MDNSVKMQIIEDNAAAKNESFLYYLKVKSSFNKQTFKDLCTAIHDVAEQDIEVGRTAQNINYIYGQILQCLMYHFDGNDKFRIAELPENYNKMVGMLNKCVQYYFSTRI